QDARTDEVPEMEALVAWLVAHLPRSGPPSIIHNDFKHDNIILDPADLARVIGILDWEMATIGDPLMDLGTTLCYWVEAPDPPGMQVLAFGPTMMPGSLTRAGIVARYAEKTGRDLSAIEFYYRFGLFKTAVVVQQIYYRWKMGLTKDARFASMN